MRATKGLSTIAQHKGGSIINDTDLHTINASQIFLSADATVTRLKHSGSDENVRGLYVSTPGSAVGGNGGYISAQDGKSFTEIELGAGNANLTK